MRAWILLLIALAVAGPSLACSSTAIIPPTTAAEPQQVFLLDHGRHASLVLPAGDSVVVRYSYGDWRWYAQQREGVFRGSTAVLWPTRAALGRRELASVPDSVSVRRAVRVGIEHMYMITVDAGDVLTLRRELDSLFDAHAETRIYNSAYDLEFVHHPTPYWLLHNSNQVVAAWLKRLGCTVRGGAMLSNWRIVRRER